MELSSIYLGGGTPSLVPVTLLGRLLDTLRAHFTWSANCEVTMEMDPATFDGHAAQQIAELGVTRCSVGVQTLDQSLLRHLGRSHKVQDTWQALAWLADARFTHGISVDLMSGLPGQTMATLMSSVDAVAAMPHVKHVSAYDLKVFSHKKEEPHKHEGERNGRKH